MQVSFDPLLLALSINPHHSSYGLWPCSAFHASHRNVDGSMVVSWV
jgi:hypothetical protein